MQRTEESLRDLWGQYQTHHWIIGVQEKEKRNGMRKFWRGYSWKFPNMENEEQPESRVAKTPIQDKPKKKHTKTYTNQSNKD